MSLKILQKKMGIDDDGIIGKNTLIHAKTYFNFTDFRCAHFFGQTAHETGGFTMFEENLNYSAKSLINVFRKYFTDISAQQYAKKPQAIANRVYANRMGNGPESSGDGWKYRGRGALQLTGRDNYKKFSNKIGVDLLLNPDLVATEYSFESAIFFFDNNNIWKHCDAGVNDSTISTITKIINGGFHGLDDRKTRTNAYYNVLIT